MDKLLLWLYISTCPITIKCFEARFQGTSGYQIHTKTGTFIGFEITPLAWTLVGSVAAGVASISTFTCSPIPIAVNVTIPAGASQSFYLTRNDNVIANRHLYITGLGTAGTTVYANDVNIQVTEAEYLDFPFGPLQVGVRRPSLDIYYDKNCVLPIELISFEGKNISNYNNIQWTTATEINNSHFVLERSTDASNWKEIDRMDGTNQHETVTYVVNDKTFEHVVNYYRLTQVDFDGSTKYSDIIAINNNKDIPTVIKIRNILGQEVTNDFKGIKIVYYSNGTVQKVVD